jgi:hypothetical protein
MNQLDRHMAHVGESRGAYRKLERRRPFGRLGIDGQIILK